MLRTLAIAFGAALLLVVPARAERRQPAAGSEESSKAEPGSSKAEPAGEDWPLERVELADGGTYEGLIEREDTELVYLRQVRRQPGKPMYLIGRRFPRDQITKLVRLPAAGHAALARRIDEHQRRAGIEAGAMKSITLRPWQEATQAGWRYRGPWCQVESHADEDTTRRAIVRIEQAFAGFMRVLPARTQPVRPLDIVLCASTAEYRARLEKEGLRIANPAVYLAKENTIIAATDLDQYAAQVSQIRAAHDEQRRQHDALREKLAAQLARERRDLEARGIEPGEIRRLLARTRRQFDVEIAALEQRLTDYDRRNAALFDELTRRTLARLFHEACHAYLRNAVFPPDDYDVPGWLNEGLAQVFESGLLEVGTLRIDAPPPEWLARLQADLTGAQPLPLAELLAADARVFLVAHDAPADESARLYLYAWGLAWYLAFDQPLFGTPSLERYLSRSGEPSGAIPRFEKLVGMPLAKFESRWRADLLTLAPRDAGPARRRKPK